MGSSPIASGQAPAERLLTWTAPAPCPPVDVVETEIERLVGRRPEAGPLATVVVRARRGVLSALLTLGAQRRRIDASTCEALVRAVALVIALHVDPDAPLGGPSSVQRDATSNEATTRVASGPDPLLTGAPPEPLSRDDAPPAPPLRDDAPPLLDELDRGSLGCAEPIGADPEAPLSSPSPPLRHPEGSFLAGFAATVDVGSMPEVSMGVWLGAAARLGPHFEVGLEGRFQPEQRAWLAPRPTIGAEVTFVAGRFRLGIAWSSNRAPRIEFVPIAALELGAMSARAVGLLRGLSGTGLWWALDVGFEARVFFLDALGVFARSELQIALQRSSFVVEGYATPVFRAADAGVVVLAGLVLQVR